MCVYIVNKLLLVYAPIVIWSLIIFFLYKNDAYQKDPTIIIIIHTFIDEGD